MAAVASLSTNDTLMKQIIPPGQSFQTDYAGQFWEGVPCLFSQRSLVKNFASLLVVSWEEHLACNNSGPFWSAKSRTLVTPGTEQVQALADISRSVLCCHSNETRAPIAHLPNSAQLEGTVYHSPKLHALLGVRSATSRHQPPRRTVLSQVDCFIQCEVVGSQISLDGVQPCDTVLLWWSLPVLWLGSR